MARPHNRGLNLGVLLLLSELFGVGVERIPPVTLAAIIGQLALFIGIIRPAWDRWDVCVSGNTILWNKDYKRLFFSAFEHDDDWHLYYNMVSFLVKGRKLEPLYGSANFALLILAFTVLTNGMYVGLARCASIALEDTYYMKVCAIGFSGVLFALKVVAARRACPSRAYYLGMNIPMRYAIWLELFVIHIIAPHSSFLGHLAGILVGLIYESTELGRILDKLIVSITGIPYNDYRSYYRWRSSR